MQFFESSHYSSHKFSVTIKSVTIFQEAPEKIIEMPCPQNTDGIECPEIHDWEKINKIETITHRVGEVLGVCQEKFVTLCIFFISGFTFYLMSPECDIFDPDHNSVCHDMTQPLSHYFIASSHNT